ncbi:MULTISPECIES: TraB/GumN family protein [unclassified Novosphingobium]|uniref:TraB/GumN family protein n=1 Tax=unclassified Novosphingobium TaxID=2644732 RepID=UPI00146D4753|nr:MULTISPECIES: TraB/GumN family protein [unclassified Novosphingobium]NMN03929.1 hypothetical protein [Novosphingobium sp. SG919]NMN86081.1 hypothetical protein [Novosphingobium sp. SG916]
MRRFPKPLPSLISACAVFALLWQPLPAKAQIVPSLPAADTPPPPSRPALWKVSDADTTIWLFGTIHVLPKGGAPWLVGPVAQALQGSDTLVTEIARADTQASAEHGANVSPGMLPAGQTLPALLGPERAGRLAATLTASGVPAAQFDAYKPWMAATALSLLPLIQRGYLTSQGVEATLENAHPQKQEALETVAFQLGLLDGLPQDAQIAWLDTVIAQYDTIGAQIAQMVNAWRAGDPDELGRLMTADMQDDPRLVETLLTRRNATWAKWIVQRLKTPGTVFVAVGAGHLAGKGSVQDDLAKDGIAVTRVQ